MDEIIKQFNLPKYIKGKSFADASKLINSKFEGMNDKISNETKMELLERLASAQEFMKVQQAQQQVLPQGNIPKMGNEFMNGGYANNDYFFGGFMNMLGQQSGRIGSIFSGGKEGTPSLATPEITGQEQQEQQGKGMGIASKGLGIASDIAKGLMDNSNQDGLGKPQDAGSSAIGGALDGAKAGMALGPIGAIGGALIGGVSGLIGGNKAYKNYMKKEKEGSQLHANEINNPYFDGGFMDLGPVTGEKYYDKIDPNMAQKYAQKFADRKGISIDINDPQSVMAAQRLMPGVAVDGKWGDQTMAGSMQMNSVNPQSRPGLTPNSDNLNIGLDLPNMPRPRAQTLDHNLQMRPGMKMTGPTDSLSIQQRPNSQPSGQTSKGGSNERGSGFNAESLLRYAPVAMNAFQLFDMDKPEYEALDRINKRYEKDYVDEMRLQNLVQNEYNNTAGAIANATGGSRGALRANMLGAQLNKTKALSDAYMKADNINRAQNDTAQRFNLGIDQFNVGQSNREKDINARNRAAYDNNRSKFLGQIGNDLGDIGLEAYRRRYPELMDMDYDAKGRLITKREADKEAKKKKRQERKNR